MLMLQVQTIVGVQPEEQLLLGGDWEGALTHEAARAKSEAGEAVHVPADAHMVLMREGRHARAVTSDTSGSGKPLLVQAPLSAAPGRGGIIFQLQKLQQIAAELLVAVPDDKKGACARKANQIIGNMQ